MKLMETLTLFLKIKTQNILGDTKQCFQTMFASWPGLKINYIPQLEQFYTL
jgi:septation ring formation regulator EzrA